MNTKRIIGALVIVGGLAWGGTAFFTTTLPYVSISRAIMDEGSMQVMGRIDTSSVVFSVTETRLEFHLQDIEDSLASTSLAVQYYGVVPGNFDQASSVVVKGKADGKGHFVADQILVKCPSKYQGEGREYQDMRKDQNPAATSI